MPDVGRGSSTAKENQRSVEVILGINTGICDCLTIQLSVQ